MCECGVIMFGSQAVTLALAWIGCFTIGALIGSAIAKILG